MGANKGSVFGSGAPSLSSFASPAVASPAQPPAPPKLTFGGATGASPFASVSPGTNGFGAPSPFGATLTGIRPLGSFAASAGSALKADKPARPFGAPDSDAEDDKDDKDGDDDEVEHHEVERAQSPEKESEEKKKLRLQKGECLASEHDALV